jgi:hypothetical protein
MGAATVSVGPTRYLWGSGRPHRPSALPEPRSLDPEARGGDHLPSCSWGARGDGRLLGLRLGLLAPTGFPGAIQGGGVAKLTGRPTGRPSIYSEELADDICETLASGDIGLERLCNETERFPAPSVVWKWKTTVEGFTEKVTTARERQMERLLYAAADEVRDCDPDSGNGNARVALARTWVESAVKISARLAPRRFGDQKRVDLYSTRSTLMRPRPSLEHLTPEEIAEGQRLAAKALMGPPRLASGPLEGIAADWQAASRVEEPEEIQALAATEDEPETNGSPPGAA